MKGFDVKEPQGHRYCARTVKCSWSRAGPYNNVVRTTIETMAAVFGGTQGLQQLRRPCAAAGSRRAWRNTQLIIGRKPLFL
jgi:methylmalonyl-CoA mutase N-terminal domain/subunit